MAESFTDENESETKKTRRKSKSQRRKSSGIVFAVWLLIFLVLLIAFVIYSPKVMKNLKNSDFFKHRNSQTTENPVNTDSKKTAEAASEPAHSEPQKKPEGTVEFSLIEKTDTEEPAPEVKKPQSEETKKPEQKSEDSSVTAKNDAAKKQQESAAEQNKKEPEKPAKKEEPKKEPEPKAPATREITLCFLNIKSDGTIVRKEAKRSIKKTDSPLTDAINELLKGPTVAEENAGCTTLISRGTKLLSARVANGVATLNFSDEIENNNSIGVESLRAQVQQIVFTSTIFPTVSSVQILVNGVKRSYFQCDAEELFFIGSPLSRNSF
ncbi:MAG: GerMN domain-containing protein [Treponema sp.]|nr:GerMN domain-containing protein [Treponema sp.]